MTNVSKRKLNKKQQQKLFQQVTGLFATVNKLSSKSLFSELFTEAEQIMFMKRLAIIVMVDKDYSRYRIAKTLKVSETTVDTIRKKYFSGEYDGLLGQVRSKKFDSESFWETLDVLLRLGMPSMGKDRWQSLRGL